MNGRGAICHAAQAESLEISKHRAGSPARSERQSLGMQDARDGSPVEDLESVNK
jgi:hypothetical protein